MAVEVSKKERVESTMLEVAELPSRREEDRMGLGFPIETRME